MMILAVAAAFVSCTDTIKYEYDLTDGKITILGQLSTSDTDHTLFLSMSYPDRIDSLPGAEVNCYVNGTLHKASQIPWGYEEQIDWMTLEPVLVPRRERYSRYMFQADFKPGDKVRVEASKGDLSAWAEVIVPQPGILVSVDTATVVKSYVYQDIDGSETYDQEYVEFTARLRDVEGTDSYFTMDADRTVVTRLSSEGDGHNETIIEGPERMDYETFHDQILEDGYSSGMGSMLEDIMPVNSMHCFSDRMFRDGEATVHFYIPSYYFNGFYFYYDADKAEVDRAFRLSFRSIDRGFYNYLRAMNNLLCYGFDVSPIIEPTMLPSNVNGGMGMVSVSSGVFLDIPLETEVYYREDFEDEWYYYYY